MVTQARLTDLEAAFGGRLLVDDLDVGDVRVGRAAASPLDDLLDSIRLALEDGLDPAIVPVERRSNS